jgi:predicted oxidoreductase
MAKDYVFRHREVYKGIPIDDRANTQKELGIKLSAKKARIDRFGRATFTDMTVREWSQRWMETYVDGSTGFKT